MTRIPITMLRLALLVLLWSIAAPPSAAAQSADDADARPAFSLSTSESFTTKDAPHFFLTFRRVPSLDIRVYKVRDPFAFFGGLRDPHQFGSDEPYDVPQERSWIERLSDWKRRQRNQWRNVARAQVSYRYRAERRAATDKAQTAQRVQLNVNTFAQVPLLNPDQLVTSWRELLPNHRDPEFRRVPLAVSEPGVYLVEAVHDRLRAYTIVMVSDVGVVTKTSPGQMLLFAADRFTGEPLPACEVRVLRQQRVVAEGTTSTDGVFMTDLPSDAGAVLGIARCGDGVAATDPGAWVLDSPARELVAYTYTDKSIYRPGQTVHVKSILRWRSRDALLAFDGTEVELVASDEADKVVFRRMLKVDAFGAVAASFPIPATGALGNYRLRIQSGDFQAASAFEVQEYRKPEFEVIVTPEARFVRQGREAVVTVQARYYFGQPVANGQLHWVLNQQTYMSPLRWDDGFEGGESTYWYGDNQTAQGDARLDADGRATLRIPLAPHENAADYSARIEAQVTDASSRQVSGTTIVHATWGSFLLSSRLDRSIFRPGDSASIDVRALDYLGVPRAGTPLSIVVERLTYASGYYNDPTATTVAETSATTGDDGRGMARFTLPSGQTGSFRISVRAQDGDRTVTTQSWLWVPGPSETDVSDGDRYLELMADQRSY
ncbi:MAG: hypothetical protein IT178_08545, partial [Acidobacteria bacterium]|nr:hypothetical protein [Acidobacteriota bacterium]